jgi:5-methylcytosine-specific restriction endonuclease McrA
MQVVFLCGKGKRMRIPNNMSLASYIRKLIKQDKVYLFYQTDEWKELRADVLEELHNECQDCLLHGRYTEADCVHHHNEVRHRPDLALSKYYTDAQGQRQRQLIPLCNTCHNIRHEKLMKWQSKDKFTNEERW